MHQCEGKNRSPRLRVVYSAARIAAEVQRLAEQISIDYAGRNPVVIVVLKGAFVFAADLVRKITVPITIDFVTLKSYSGTATTGEVAILKDIDSTLAGRDVLIIEDIIDTGLSLEFLLGHLRSKRPATVKICALVDKRSGRRSPSAPDYAGVACEGGFLVGYGLDLDEHYRELPDIYEVVTQPLVEV